MPEPVATFERELPALSEEEVQAVRSRRWRCHLAGKVAIALAGQAAGKNLGRGILKKETPIFDVGCRNPYIGMWFTLRRDFNWAGTYYGMDATIPRQAVQEWERKRRLIQDHGKNFKMWSRALEVGRDEWLTWGGRVVIPPTSGDPHKPFGVAFAVDTLGRVKERERLVAEMKRVAASVVIVGGATGAEMNAWDFQNIGTTELPDGHVAIGVWLDLRAEDYRRHISVVPKLTAGWFSHKDPRGQGGMAMYGRHLGVCQKCGKPDVTGRSRFECAFCGAPNNIAGPIRVNTASN